MQRRLLYLFSYLALSFSGMLFLSQCNQPENLNLNRQASEPTPELANYMSRLQYFSHKLALSVDAKNTDAAAFYFHEVKELVEAVKEEVPEYEGYDISRLTENMLEPKIALADSALHSNNWKETRIGMVALIDACNACHHATDHGFIQVTPGFNDNPYNQVFEPR